MRHVSRDEAHAAGHPIRPVVAKGHGPLWSTTTCMQSGDWVRTCVCWTSAMRGGQSWGECGFQSAPRQHGKSACKAGHLDNQLRGLAPQGVLDTGELGPERAVLGSKLHALLASRGGLLLGGVGPVFERGDGSEDAGDHV